MKTRRVIPCFTTCVNKSSHNIQIWTGRASSFTRTPKYEFLHIFCLFFLSFSREWWWIDWRSFSWSRERRALSDSCLMLPWNRNKSLQETSTTAALVSENFEKRQIRIPYLFHHRTTWWTGAHPCRAPQKHAARPGGRLGLFDSWNKCANISSRWKYFTKVKIWKYTFAKLYTCSDFWWWWVILNFEIPWK